MPSWCLIPAITFNRPRERDHMTQKGRRGNRERERFSPQPLIPSRHVESLDVCERLCDSLIKLKGFCCGASDLHFKLSWSDIYQSDTRQGGEGGEVWEEWSVLDLYKSGRETFHQTAHCELTQQSSLLFQCWTRYRTQREMLYTDYHCLWSFTFCDFKY